MEHKKESTTDGKVFNGHQENPNMKIGLFHNKSTSNSLFKRTLKISTALYMVTECINDTDYLKHSLRTECLNLLKKVSSIDMLTGVKTSIVLEEIENDLCHLLGLIELGHTVGSIGEMNGSILMKELTLLSTSFDALTRENREGKYTTTLFRSQSLEKFTVPADMLQWDAMHSDSLQDQKSNASSPTVSLQNDKGHEELLKKYLSFNKGHQINPQQKSQGLIEKEQLKGQSKKIELALKNDRRNNIFALLKDKPEIMIKDIAQVIKNCSEKTLQRELMSLVKEGVLKKIGEKRWSKYSLK
jgi:hypothetical protein